MLPSAMSQGPPWLAQYVVVRESAPSSWLSAGWTTAAAQWGCSFQPELRTPATPHTRGNYRASWTAGPALRCSCQDTDFHMLRGHHRAESIMHNRTASVSQSEPILCPQVARFERSSSGGTCCAQTEHSPSLPPNPNRGWPVRSNLAFYNRATACAAHRLSPAVPTH